LVEQTKQPLLPSQGATPHRGSVYARCAAAVNTVTHSGVQSVRELLPLPSLGSRRPAFPEGFQFLKAPFGILRQ
jgi:hypothetical protein